MRSSPAISVRARCQGPLGLPALPTLELFGWPDVAEREVDRDVVDDLERARDEERQAEPEEQDGERRWIETPTQEEPVRDDRLHNEPAREGVEAEEERKLGDRPRRPVDPEEAPLAFDLREFDPVAEGEEDREIEKPDHRVEGEERAVRVGAVQTLRGEEAHRCGGE